MLILAIKKNNPSTKPLGLVSRGFIDRLALSCPTVMQGHHKRIGKGIAMLSLNRIDNSIEYYGERIGVLDNGYNPYDAFIDIENACSDSLTIEERIADSYDKGLSEWGKEGWNDAIEKIQYDLDCFLDYILDHSEHELSEAFKDELYKGIAGIIQDAKNT